MNARVQVVFFGEVIRGHRMADVRHDLGELLQIDEAGRTALFSGARIVIEPSMDIHEAQDFERSLRDLGARVHIETADPDAEASVAAFRQRRTGAPREAPSTETTAPAPLAPAAAANHAPRPGSTTGRSAAAAPPATETARPFAPSEIPTGGLIDEEVTCPHCGERQTNRIMCRSCGTNIPMALAHQRETESDARALRLAQARARRGLPPSPTGANHAADAPSAWGLGFEGRLARLPYISAFALLVMAVNLLFVYAIPHPSPARLYTLIAGTVLLSIFAVRLSVLRAHDFNGSGWWAALLLVPYVGAVVALGLMALPGTREENDHGGRPRPGNPLLALMAVALMTVTLIATYRWIAAMVEEVIPTGGASAPRLTEKEIAARLPSPDAVTAFRDEYMPAAAPKAFAVSPSGSWGWKAGAASSESAAASALETCDSRRKLYTPACELINANDRWVQR